VTPPSVVVYATLPLTATQSVVDGQETLAKSTGFPAGASWLTHVAPPSVVVRTSAVLPRARSVAPPTTQSLLEAHETLWKESSVV
jgi:hypothetical protein